MLDADTKKWITEELKLISEDHEKFRDMFLVPLFSVTDLESYINGGSEADAELMLSITKPIGIDVYSSEEMSREVLFGGEKFSAEAGMPYEWYAELKEQVENASVAQLRRYALRVQMVLQDPGVSDIEK